MPRWLKILLLGLVVFAAGFGVLLYVTGTPADQAVKLIGNGPFKQLRDEMRPARAEGPRVLVIALDGVGDGAFREALAAGRLPRIAALLGEPTDDPEVFAHGYTPSGTLSILPSTTYAAWTSVFTGEPVARHGIPGNEWFDRETVQFVAPAPVSVTGYGDAARVYTEDLVGEWTTVPTLFERAGVRSYATLVAQHRGADLLIQPDLSLLQDLVTALAAGLSGNGDADFDTYRALDEMGVQRTLDAFEEYGLPDLQVVYFPGVDLYTHLAEHALAEQNDYLGTVVDPAVGRLLDAYGDRLDYVFFVADHGHTPTLDTDRHALGSGGDDEPPTVLEHYGFRVRPFERDTSEDDFQAVFAYQGAFAYLTLADRSTCPNAGDVCDWSRPPRMEEDVLEAVHAFDRATRDGHPAPELRGTLDLIFAREPRGIEPAEPFRVWDGDRLVPVGEYLAANPRPDLLDLEARLDALAAGPLGHRVGDVLLLSRYRFEDPIEQRFYFSNLYRSWHGSPSAQDSEILWVLAHPQHSGEALRERTRRIAGPTPSQLDVTPLLLDLLGAE